LWELFLLGRHYHHDALRAKEPARNPERPDLDIREKTADSSAFFERSGAASIRVLSAKTTPARPNDGLCAVPYSTMIGGNGIVTP